MPKQKHNLKRSNTKKINNNPLDGAAYYRLGCFRNGDKKPTKLKLPKARLSSIEYDFLRLFMFDPKARPTIEALVEYKARFEKETTIAIASTSLMNLAHNGFLKQTKGKVRKINNVENRIATIIKTKYALHEDVKNGKLTVDVNRWVMLDGIYIASETLRARTELRENRRRQRLRSMI